MSEEEIQLREAAADRALGNGLRRLTANRGIERLIDRELILQQAKQEPGLEVSDEELDKEIAALKKELPGCRKSDCTTAAGWNRFLNENGFTPGRVSRPLAAADGSAGVHRGAVPDGNSHPAGGH